MIACLALGLIAGPALAGNSLIGRSGSSSPLHTSQRDATQSLFRGDLIAERGIGCSNGSGTAGGPQDLAVGVTATAVAAPFDIVSTTYNIFTNISPNITSLSFVAWTGGGTPGAELARRTGLPFTTGNHTQSFATAISMASPAFYFGVNQAQTNVGIRLGQDTTAPVAGTSFIRATTCGAAAFITVEAAGVAGNWVMAVLVDDNVPVELMSFDVE